MILPNNKYTVTVRSSNAKEKEQVINLIGDHTYKACFNVNTEGNQNQASFDANPKCGG